MYGMIKSFKRYTKVTLVYTSSYIRGMLDESNTDDNHFFKVALHESYTNMYYNLHTSNGTLTLHQQIV